MPVFDLNALNNRITEILKMPLDDVVVPETLSDMQETLLKFISAAVALQRIQGLKKIRVEYGDPTQPLGGCVCSGPKKEIPLGSGAFGSVFSAHASPCMNVPKGVSKVAVKKEKVELYWNDMDFEAVIGKRKQIYAQAYKLGLGPRVYDIYICIGSDNSVNIITIMDLVHGKTWSSVEWPNPVEKEKAVDKITIAIQRLNKHGILHHDLHGGNIMVSVSKKGVMTDFKLIDFDLARFVKDAEGPYLKNSLLNTYGSENTTIAKKVLIKMQELGNIGTLSPPVPPVADTKKTRKARKTRKAH